MLANVVPKKLKNGPLYRSLHRNVFPFATTLAVAAILVSCLVAYHALRVLPNTHRQIVGNEEQLGRLASLRFTLGSVASRLRTLSVGGDEQDQSELVESVARSVQLLEELEGFSGPASLQPLLADCRMFLAEVHPFATGEAIVAASDRVRFRDQVAGLRTRLDASIVSAREHLATMKQAAQLEQQEATWALVGGHALMLGVVGLLYAARRSEKRLRHQADLRTLQADERFALIVRGSADGIILTDETGRIQMTNPALDEMFAAHEGELQGQNVGSLFATTAVDEWLANRFDDDDRESSLSRTVTATRLSGDRFLAELTITPRTIHDQEFLAISVRDVSEREASRVRLKQHEALLSEIPEPLHILDGVGRIVYWNRGAERLFGYTPGEAIGQSANDLLRIVPPKGETNNIHVRGYSRAEHWTGELRATTKSGHSIRIERRRTRIREQNEAIGEVVLDLDLGERSRMQQVERRRQRLESLGELASGIAHDLNNLLTPILMSSRMLQRENANINREALIETIASGASRGADLIAQLLTFARGGECKHQPLRIQDIVPEIVVILEHTLPQDIDLQVEIEPGLPEVFGDATEISQVVMNLAINARDAMAQRGNLGIVVNCLTLATERSYSYATLQPGEYVTITVSDTGTGIPPSIRDRIFDPFFTTKERGQGTGLGLSTSIGIVRSHQGVIEVRSKVGKGTQISVILPARPPSSNDNGTPR